jgi:heat shock protein HslJ
MRWIGWTAALVLGFAPAALAQDLPASAWQVTGVGAFAVTADDGVTLDFTDGQIAGRSGCNRYTGSVTLTALTPGHGTLALGPVASTRMACPGRADEVERSFLGALGAVDAWRIEPDGALSLLAGDAPLISARPR